MTSIAWFRRDLRLEDNPAWSEATGDGETVHPLFVVDPGVWQPASQRRRSLLAAALARLDESLATLGGRLRVEYGAPCQVIPQVANELGSRKVHVNRDVTPYGTTRDRDIASKVDLVAHDGLYVHAPGSLLTQGGRPYRVFTPFYRTWKSKPVEHTPEPKAVDVASDPGKGAPKAMSDPGPIDLIEPNTRMDAFLRRVERYEEERDRPDLDATSRLSVALKFGTLGPRAALQMALGLPPSVGRDQFIRQLAWRDFFAHVMAAWPHTADLPMNDGPEIAWRNDRADIAAWKTGVTGYPLVDAGMRQLRSTGWINNRVRMVVASFLVKDLLVDWRIGERYMRHMLVDGDVPQNVGNWQWVAGTGADAAPFFRVLNPVTQSTRFDPDGTYLRRWLPELAELDNDQIHAPWEAGPIDLADAGVFLGETYPWPIVDHLDARARALAAYGRVGRSGS